MPLGGGVPQDEAVDAVGFAVLEQGIAGRLAESQEIGDRARVGGKHLQGMPDSVFLTLRIGSGQARPLVSSVWSAMVAVSGKRQAPSFSNE